MTMEAIKQLSQIRENLRMVEQTMVGLTESTNPILAKLDITYPQAENIRIQGRVVVGHMRKLGSILDMQLVRLVLNTVEGDTDVQKPSNETETDHKEVDQ